MAIICDGCRHSVEPIKVFERSPKSGKEWLISRCPRERCAYNLDIEPYANNSRKTKPKDSERYFWDGDCWR